MLAYPLCKQRLLQGICKQRLRLSFCPNCRRLSRFNKIFMQMLKARDEEETQERRGAQVPIYGLGPEDWETEKERQGQRQRDGRTVDRLMVDACSMYNFQWLRLRSTSLQSLFGFRLIGFVFGFGLPIGICVLDVVDVGWHSTTTTTPSTSTTSPSSSTSRSWRPRGRCRPLA